MILLRICVLYKRENLRRNSFSILHLGSFRGAEIYKAEISEKISKRRLLKLAKNLSELKISFVAEEPGLNLSPLLLRFGITSAIGDRFLFRHSAEAALLLSKKLSAPLSFFISGGSFWSVTRIALRLLEETNDVFVSCADFDSVAEACFDSCGAVIKQIPTKAHMTLTLFENDFELNFSDKVFCRADFALSLPDFPFDIPSQYHTALSEALHLCGVLDEREVKIVIL